MMKLDKAIEEAANALGQAALEQGAVMTTAESCTAGGISYAITAIPGSSAWFDRAFVTYSNSAKKTMLGVKEETLLAHGAVSEAVVAQMTEGALRHSEATLAVAVSGIAGPGGAVVGKPVGTVCFAWQQKGGAAHVCTQYFSGDRDAVRKQTILFALNGLLKRLSK